MTFTCWDILGLTQAWLHHKQRVKPMTEKDIQKAYRSRARVTHPDRFQDPEQKQQATEAFRKVYGAYEEALGLWRASLDQNGNYRHSHTAPNPHSGSKQPPAANSDTSTSARSSSDSNLRRTVEHICNVLQKESNDQWQKRLQEIARLVRDVWPDRDRAFEISQKAGVSPYCLEPFLEKNVFKSLRELFTQHVERSNLKLRKEDQLLIDFVKLHRDRDPASIHDEIRRRWTIFHMYDAMKMCTDPDIRASIKWHYTEQNKLYEEQITEQLQQTAQNVQRVYPNTPAMKRVLQPIMVPSHRKRVLEYLPVEMRYLAGVAMIEGQKKRIKLG